MKLYPLSNLEEMKEVIAVARGDEPADLLLTNGRVVNVFNGEINETNLAIKGTIIAAIGREYKQGKEIIDLEGKYLTPGLIDAHLHIESTLLQPAELARIIVARGTTSVINDPHEVANVLGVKGVEMMLKAAENLPCDFFSTVPSCVPATNMETAGAEIDAAQVEELLQHPGVVGLGEMMNYPGVLEGDPEVMEKILASHRIGKVVDGHAPGLSGSELQAYLAAGISTDHETITADEALEKINCGMKVIIRHGSASSSLEEILPLVNAGNVDSFMFGSDDREAAELISKGHLDDLLKTAVKMGSDPVMLIKMATINAAAHYRLYDRGALAPGFLADIVVFNNLKDFKAEMVVKNGVLAARQGSTILDIEKNNFPGEALQSVNVLSELKADDFGYNPGAGDVPVIGVVPGQLVTEKLYLDLERSEGGFVRANPGAGLNKIAVIERHHASGRMAVALVKGLELNRGALASTVAHDSHNILVAGVEEKAMAAAVNELIKMGGGFVAVNENGETLASLSLQIAGLMSLEQAPVVAEAMDKLLNAAKALGSGLPQPFLTLAFLALPVIPSLKITDRGLFDVDNFTFL